MRFVVICIWFCTINYLRVWFFIISLHTCARTTADFRWFICYNSMQHASETQIMEIFQCYDSAMNVTADEIRKKNVGRSRISAIWFVWYFVWLLRTSGATFRTILYMWRLKRSEWAHIKTIKRINVSISYIIIENKSRNKLGRLTNKLCRQIEYIYKNIYLMFVLSFVACVWAKLRKNKNE